MTLFLLLFCLKLTAQSTPITGLVTDDEGDALPFVSIQIKGTTSGCQTDGDGKYNLRAATTATLIFSYTGFETQEIEVAGRSTIDIEMDESASKLNEIVVVGYGTQRKSQVTGAIQTLAESELEDRPVSSLGNAMSGKVAGLQTIQPSGTPGAGLLISIRGNKNPLYVIDGVPLIDENQSRLSTSFDLDGMPQGAGQTTSSISDFNFEDIAHIEILKDVAATAIYGARAANGVVLITTKRGQSGKTAIHLEYQTGVQKMAREIPFQSSSEMVALLEEARANDRQIFESGKPIVGNPSILYDSLKNFDLSTGVNTNWLRAVTRPALMTDLEFSMRGGDEKTAFYMGVSWLDQQGIVIENAYKRFNYRLNADHKMSKTLTIGSNMSLSRSFNRRSFNDDTYSGIITNALGASPLMPTVEKDGSYADYTKYQASWLSDNPFLSAHEIKATTKNFRVLGTIFLENQFSKRLKFRTSFTQDALILTDSNYKSPLTVDAKDVGGEAYENTLRQFVWLNENQLNYTQETENQSVGITLAATAQHTTARDAGAVGQGFPSGGLQNVSSAAVITRADGDGSGFSILSGLGRLTYGWQSKYLATTTLRADGSSRFSKSNRFGFFPSIAVAWRISEENFFQKWKNDGFSNLKLRASYGVAGDQEIGDFQNITFYKPTNYVGHAGLQIRNLADPNLTWQTNRGANFGFDFEIDGGRWAGSVEYFSSRKTDILSEDPISGTTGFTTITRNSGEVKNTGFELLANTYLIDNEEFKWNLAINYAHVKNRITKLSSDGVLLFAYNDLAATHILKIGQPVGTFYGIKYLSVNPQTGDALYDDLNHDGSITLDDAQILGHAAPSNFGGIINNLSYENWSFSMFCAFNWGNQVYNLIRSTYDNLGYGNGDGLSTIYANSSTYVNDHWRKPDDHAAYPRPSVAKQQLIQNSSAFIENGSFFRISNVVLGYKWKPRRGGFSQVKLNLTGENLFVFTKYKGFDPEVSSNGGSSDRTAGVDYGAYPKAWAVYFGVSVGF